MDLRNQVSIRVVVLSPVANSGCSRWLLGMVASTGGGIDREALDDP